MEEFTERLKSTGVAIGMDEKDRALDNILNERLWRTGKYKEMFFKLSRQDLRKYVSHYATHMKHLRHFYRSVCSK